MTRTHGEQDNLDAGLTALGADPDRPRGQSQTERGPRVVQALRAAFRGGRLGAVCDRIRRNGHQHTDSEVEDIAEDPESDRPEVKT